MKSSQRPIQRPVKAPIPPTSIKKSPTRPLKDEFGVVNRGDLGDSDRQSKRSHRDR